MNKKKKNDYFYLKVIIFSLVISGIVFYIFSGINIEKNNIDLSNEKLMSKELTQTIKPVEELCFEVKGTPAWVQNGNIVSYGYNEGMDDVDLLIQYDFYFLYNPDCSYCQKQINLWGNKEWMKYIASGKVINCKEVIRNGYGN